jgi:DNA-binding transcriptional MerR regulator
MTTDTTLSIDEVAAILDMKPVTIKRYAREGLLDSEEHKGELRFHPDKVEQFKQIQAKLR